MTLSKIRRFHSAMAAARQRARKAAKAVNVAGAAAIRSSVAQEKSDPLASAPSPAELVLDPLLLFMYKTQDKHECTSLGGIHYQQRSCKRVCKPELPEASKKNGTATDSKRDTPLPQWRESADSNGLGGFAGNQSDAGRIEALGRCGGGGTECGFLAPSAFDAARAMTRAASTHCHVVVLTAIFGALDWLHQPRYPPKASEESCFFAFVDRESAAKARRTTKASLSEMPRVGAWRLVVLDGELPFGNARRDSRVPKMLPHRFFPSSSFCIWVDGKLQLNLQPTEAVTRYLIEPQADIAAMRNLRRDTIDHEYAWICSWMGHLTCSSGPSRLADGTISYRSRGRGARYTETLTSHQPASPLAHGAGEIEVGRIDVGRIDEEAEEEEDPSG